MPKLPQLRGRELIRILKKHGFEIIRVRGSHRSMRHPDGRYTVVPVHAGETIGPGLLNKILKDTELSRNHLKK